MLGSNREKYDISNADVEVGGDSRRENNSNLLQVKQQYSTTIFSVLLLDKYTVTVPAPHWNQLA